MSEQIQGDVPREPLKATRFLKRTSNKVSIIERRGLKGKTLFRSIARRAGQFKEWLREIDNYLSGGIRHTAGLAATKKALPIEAKMILIKNEMSRTEAEQEELEGLLSGLYFYNRYPEKEYKQLIGKTNCAVYGPGRTILRQGHPLSSQSRLYYVVVGNLSVEIETIDPITLVGHVEVVKKLGPGDQFGDKAIIFNEDRESTVTTLSDVILLYIIKDDFDAILKESLEKTWSQVRKATTELSYFFGDWTDAELRRCSIISELINFELGDLILGDGYGKRKKAHFIVNGECSMIQDIEIEEKGNGWKLITSNESESPGDDKRRQRVYLQTNVFSKGACFGVGEKMNNRRYVAESDVEFLVVPQYLLIAHNRFETYKQFLESRLFSTEQLFSSFLYSRKRLEFHSKNIHGSKSMNDSDRKIIVMNVNVDGLEKLKDKRNMKYNGARHGEGDVTIRRSTSRMMAELTKNLGDNYEIDFSEIFKKENTPQNLHVQVPLLLAQLTRERSRRRDLERILADGLEFCLKLEKQKHGLRKRIATLKCVNMKLETEVNEIQDNHNILKEQLEKGENKYSSLRVEMIEEKHANIESQMKIFEMEKEIDCLKSQLYSNNPELKTAGNIIDQLEQNALKWENGLPSADIGDDNDCPSHEHRIRLIQELEESTLLLHPSSD